LNLEISKKGLHRIIKPHGGGDPAFFAISIS
jgi:hypothetical protein